LAGEQGKYWGCNDKLFETQLSGQKVPDLTDLSYLCRELGLNTSSIKSEISSGKYIDEITADERRPTSWVRFNPDILCW